MTNGSGIDNRSGADAMGLPVLPPRNAVIELAAIVAAIVIIDWLLPDQGLSEVGPSPYWLPVLLMSLQYGTVSGLLAAGVGIAMTMLPGVPEQGVGENHFAYLLRIWAQPILWIAVAVLLGQFRIRQIAVKRELVRQVEELSSQRQALADYATNLRKRCEAIERELAGRDEPVAVELLAALSAVARPDSDLGAALGHCMALAAPGAVVSVYVLDGQRLRLIARSASGPRCSGADELTAVHPLHRAIVGGRTISILEPGHEAVLAGEGLVAVPVREAGAEAVAGMLKLDAADAIHVTGSTAAALESIATAIAQRLAVQSTGRADGRDHAFAAMAAAASSAGPLRGFFRKTSTWLRGIPSEPETQTVGDGAADRSRAAR